jgi:enediyne biosynthesis protein E4
VINRLSDLTFLRGRMPVHSTSFVVFVLVGLVGLQTTIHGAETPLPVFTDVTEQAGLDSKHGFGDDNLSNIVEGTGSGAVLFDYDGDGWLDIYLPNGAWHPDVSDNRGRRYRGQLKNRLYRNNRDGTFTEMTDEAGVGDMSFSFGASAADFDGDGHVDLYVLNYGPNVLYRNNGNGTFTDVSRTSGLDNANWSLAAPWFDFDGDGRLDVYVVNYLQYDAGKFRSFYAAAGYPGPLSYSGQPDALYHNNGDGTFTEVTKQAGVFNPDGRGMSVAVGDLNNNGLLDIYVANDAMENYLYRNQGDGTFVEQALFLGLAFGEGGQGVSSMGPVFGDVNRSGLLDVFIPDMNYGCLMMNRGEFFQDRTAQARIAMVCGQYTGWGGLLLDYDNDGYLDLFIANGNAHFEYPQHDVLLRNEGTGNFVDVASQSGDYFRQRYVGRGAAYADFDNDGDLDVLIANLNDRPRLLRNDGGNQRNWIKVIAKLPNGRSDAIGARITVRAGDLVQIHDLIPTAGYLSQRDPRPHFGLGDVPQVDSIEIRWPDQTETTLNHLEANQILTVIQEAPEESTP